LLLQQALTDLIKKLDRTVDHVYAPRPVGGGI
jgi:hypothetical protein